MNRKHITKNGEEMMICQMEDSHLIATIKLLCKNIFDLKYAIDYGDKIKKSDRVIYNQKETSIEALSGVLKGKVGLLKEYVMEATLRGLQITEYLQKAFERTKVIGMNKNILELNIHVDSIDEKEVTW